MNSHEFPELDAWRRLSASPAVREQQVAFTCATGVPLTLAPASTHAGSERIFCVKGCLGGHSGDVCRQKLLEAERRAVTRLEPTQYCCPSGLVKILVPVFINCRHAGTLLAGPLALHSLDGKRLNRLTGQLEKLGLSGRAEQLQTTWQFTPQLSSAKCRAAGTLLHMFGKYLEETGRQFLRSAPAKPSALLQRIEEFLAECRNGPVSLKEVAARVNLSPCYFCAVFKKQTGLTFRQYQTRQRLETARQLLADGDWRVSDVAFESGFESIPYFNRAFRRHFGCSPTQYRRRLAHHNPGQENPNPSVAKIGADGFND